MDCANCKEEGKGILPYTWEHTQEKKYYCADCYQELMQTLIRNHQYLQELQSTPLSEVNIPTTE